MVASARKHRWPFKLAILYEIGVIDEKEDFPLFRYRERERKNELDTLINK